MRNAGDDVRRFAEKGDAGSLLNLVLSTNLNLSDRRIILAFFERLANSDSKDRFTEAFNDLRSEWDDLQANEFDGQLQKRCRVPRCEDFFRDQKVIELRRSESPFPAIVQQPWYFW